jgi:hypothetical protein
MKVKADRTKKTCRDVLTGSLNLREFEGNSVREIRCTHNELIACYAVKEEVLCLIESRDEKEAYRATAD